MKDLDLPWVVDPITKKPSVSLSNFVISGLFLLVIGALHVAGKVQETGIALEYFGISSALYFGRRFTFGSKVYESAIPETQSQPEKGTVVNDQK